MLDVKVNKKLKQIPENWEELKADKELVSHTMKLFGQHLQADELVLSVALHAIGIKKHRYQFVPPDVAAILIEKLNFIVTEHPGGLQENLLPRLGKLYGTAHLWRDIGTWEYAVAEKHFFGYAETQAPQELDLFVAVWYRKKRRFARKGDLRRPFDDNDYKARTKHLAKVPQWKKAMVWQYFLYQREQAVLAHPNLFSGTGDEDSAWADTIIALSRPGDEDKTGAVPIAVTLRRLEMKAKEQKELEQKTMEADENL